MVDKHVSDRLVYFISQAFVQKWEAYDKSKPESCDKKYEIKPESYYRKALFTTISNRMLWYSKLCAGTEFYQLSCGAVQLYGSLAPSVLDQLPPATRGCSDLSWS